MEIFFKARKLEKICTKQKQMAKEFSVKMQRKLKQRMMELKAADTLQMMSHLPPPRLHELTGNRKGQYSVDLEHPYRLLFIVANEPVPLNVSGGIDKNLVTQIEIIAIADTH